MSIMELLNGKKTYIGGVAAIGIGALSAVYEWSQGQTVDWKLIEGWLVAGWTIIGGRSAINKMGK